MRIRILLLFLVLGLCTACRDKLHKRILVVHSYEDTYEGYPDYNRMLEHRFRKEGIDAELAIFYLDCESYGEKAEIKRLYHLLDSISSWHPDIILVNEDQATYSLLKTFHPLIQKIPIVFAGVNYPNWELIRKYPNVTGFHDKIDFVKNIMFIEKICNDPKNITTILDFTYLDQQVRQDAENQCQGTNIHFIDEGGSFSPIARDTGIWVRAITARLRNNTSSFLWYITKFSTSPYLQLKRDFTTINVSAIASNTCFTAINASFGYHAKLLGGYFTPLEVQVKEEVKAAAEILQGKHPQEMPVQESAKAYQLDWRVMEEIGMTKEKVPGGCEIVNMPFVVRYPWLCFWGGLIILGLLGALFFLLYYLYRRESHRRKQVLTELEKQREALALAIQGGGTYAWQAKGDYLSFETSFWKWLGEVPRLLPIEEFIAFCHPDYRELFCRHHQNKVLGKFSFEMLCDFNGKGYQWWEFRYSNILTSLGNYKSAGLLLNIQDFKQREQELIEARELAEKAELKQSFLANMSHEIRTPLNAIVGFSNILASSDALPEDDRKQYIDIINTNSDLLLKLINDILELSRIESGYMSFQCEDCLVDELLEEVYSTHKVLISGNLGFYKALNAPGIIINVDKGRLTQVLSNFLNNARKFTTTGYIKLGSEYFPESREVHIYVEDTGKGISPSEQKMIFNRFYKQDEFAQGTGLGLAICQVIIGRLNGHINLCSELGQGSRFTVILPVSAKN